MLNTLTIFKKNRAVFYEATWSKTREDKASCLLLVPMFCHEFQIFLEKRTTKKNTYPDTSSHLDLFFNTHHSYIVILLANLLALCYKSKNTLLFQHSKSSIKRRVGLSIPSTFDSEA